jgi:hypothetical protein
LIGQPRRDGDRAGALGAAFRSPDVSSVYVGLMRAALLLALLPGLGVGLLLVCVYGFRLPLLFPWPQLAQGHGQVQLLGFTLLFVMAVGLQLLPRFLAAPIRRPGRVGAGGALVALAVVLRLVAQPLDVGPARTAALVVAAAALPAGTLLALAEFASLRRRSVQPTRGPAAAWQAFVAVAVLALAAALLLHTAALLRLAGGAALVPTGLDEALIHLELAGFATSMVLGVGSRILGRMLLLRGHPALGDRLPLLAAAYGCGLAVAGAGWALDAAWLRPAGYAAELAVVSVWLWLVGLYGRPRRPSSTPRVTDPTRRWLRGAFAFLLLGAALRLGLAGREVLVGTAAAGTELSAARHAAAQGFLLVVMVVMAARMMPVYAADVAGRRGFLEAAVDLLLVGALLRVGAELVGGYAGPAGPLTALGGIASVAGFGVFAAGLWASLARLPVPRAEPQGGAARQDRSRPPGAGG